LSITWLSAMAGLEAATAVCAGLSLAYFAGRMASREREPLFRRAAAFVLALVSLAALAESAAFLAGAGIDSGSWAMARGLTFAGMGCMSALVVRAMGDGK